MGAYLVRVQRVVRVVEDVLIEMEGGTPELAMASVAADIEKHPPTGWEPWTHTVEAGPEVLSARPAEEESGVTRFCEHCVDADDCESLGLCRWTREFLATEAA